MKNDSIYRFHLVDEGQDLLWIDVDGDGEMGEIVRVNTWTPPIPIWQGKAVDFGDNKPGKKFNCADPRKDFEIIKTRWKVEKVERLSR